MQKQRAAIYARVSTLDQHPEVQERELIQYVRRRGWTVYKRYIDKGISGSIERRPALDSLIQDCRRGRVDVVVVWKFDRFSRSLKQLVMGLDFFRQHGIQFISCTEGVDTSSPTGECLFQIIGAIAAFERNLIADRVKAGLQHARMKGKRLGRPPVRVLKAEEVADLRSERLAKSTPFRLLAKKFGISIWTAHSLCTHSRQRRRR